MASRDDDSGSLTNRLMSRADPGLRKSSVQGGGDVYSGPTASRALKALGARAMTMDDTIFVDEGFDTSNPEDAALYAHEAHHQDESGGSDQHGSQDAEETQARAIERMVLHRVQSGESIGDILADIKGGGRENMASSDVASTRGNTQTQGTQGEGGGSELTDGDAMKAYNEMIGSGKDHATIVRELVQYCVETISRQEEDHLFRKSELDFY